MKFLTSLLVLFVLAGFCFLSSHAAASGQVRSLLTSPLRGRVMNSASSAHVHRVWHKHSHMNSVDPHAVLHLTIALKQRNLAQLKSIATAVSDPFSPSYGQHLSLEELRDLVAPTKTARQHVQTFFKQHGATYVTETLSGDFINVGVPVHVASTLFGNPQFHLFEHKHSNRKVIRTLDQWYIPFEIEKHVDVITGLHDFFDHTQERQMTKLAHQLNSTPSHQKRFQHVKVNKQTLPHLLASTAVRSACGSSAPTFGRMKGSSKDLSVIVELWCQDGVYTSNPASPCSDNGRTAIRLITLNIGDKTGVAEYSLVPNAQVCQFNSVTVQCTFPTIFFTEYNRLNISAASQFNDGTTSPLGYFPTLFSPSPYLTPDIIATRYGIPPHTVATNTQNLQGVPAFEEQYINTDTDYYNFQKYMGIPWNNCTIIGQNDPTNPGGESTLDIQWISAMGAGVPSIFMSVTGPGPAKPPGQGAYILEWAALVNNMATGTAPWVWSVSYGDEEMGYFNKFGSFSYIDRMEVELQKFAARGFTVFAGSGDAGASNVGEAGNDISPTQPSCDANHPFYPSNSPWVTSVSSTFLSPNYLPVCSQQMSPFLPITCEKVGEVAVGVTQGLFWTTGGGFSNRSDVNPIPEWQAEAVYSYLKQAEATNTLPPSTYFNNGGRGYPDVATLGHNLIMHFAGSLTTVDGTSASGPVMAGMLSLINDARLNAGLSTMGCVNPFLYAAANADPSSFNDIVVGDNKSGDIQSKCSPYATFCENGFQTAPGWDPVTGLGSPNISVLKELALTKFKPSMKK